MAERDVVVIGASLGGVEALKVIVGGLPRELAAAVLVVLHTGPRAPYLLPGMLTSLGGMRAVQTVDGMPIERGLIYVAPPDFHMLVKDERVSMIRGPKENGSRPAIDPLFRSAAMTWGARVIGVILTGLLDDGTAGLSVVQARGGTTVVQDPKDAQCPSMPSSALRYVKADYVPPVSEIAALLTRLVKEPVKASASAPISRLHEVEARFVAMETMSIEEMNTIGTHVGISCPECHGPIWKIRDRNLQRYRCHVGHAYTAETMMEGQVEAQEIHLWQALRLMKERASLLFEMQCFAKHEERLSDAEGYGREVARLQRDTASIQAMIRDGEPEGVG